MLAAALAARKTGAASVTSRAACARSRASCRKKSTASARRARRLAASRRRRIAVENLDARARQRPDRCSPATRCSTRCACTRPSCRRLDAAPRRAGHAASPRDGRRCRQARAGARRARARRPRASPRRLADASAHRREVAKSSASRCPTRVEVQRAARPRRVPRPARERAPRRHRLGRRAGRVRDPRHAVRRPFATIPSGPRRSRRAWACWRASRPAPSSSAINEILRDWATFARPVPHLYGDGRAGDKIASPVQRIGWRRGRRAPIGFAPHRYVTCAAHARYDSPLKVCMVVPYDLAEEGGVKRHAMQLGEHAARARRRGRPDRPDLAAAFARHRAARAGFRGIVNVRANGSDNILGIFVCPMKIAQLIRERHYDVIHVHEPLQPSLTYCAVWMTGKAAHVATFHGYMENESKALLRARSSGRRSRSRSTTAASRCRRRRTTYAHVSSRSRSRSSRTASAPSCTRRAERRSRGTPLRILFVGHWRDSRKGAAASCSTPARGSTERGCAWTLDIVGDGGTQAKPTLPGITYHGPISSERQVAELYAGCDVFASPALGGESFGIVLLEAMAFGAADRVLGYRRLSLRRGRRSRRRRAVGRPWRCRGHCGGARRARRGSGAARAARRAQPRLRAPLRLARLAERVREEYLAALASRGVEIAPRPAQSAPAVRPAEPVQSSPAAQPAPVEAAAADALV